MVVLGEVGVEGFFEEGVVISRFPLLCIFQKREHRFLPGGLFEDGEILVDTRRSGRGEDCVVDDVGGVDETAEDGSVGIEIVRLLVLQILQLGCFILLFLSSERVIVDCVDRAHERGVERAVQTKVGQSLLFFL